MVDLKFDAKFAQMKGSNWHFLLPCFNKAYASKGNVKDQQTV